MDERQKRERDRRRAEELRANLAKRRARAGTLTEPPDGLDHGAGQADGTGKAGAMGDNDR